MGGFRDETMIRIRQDYLDHGMESVLAKHLLGEKREIAQSLNPAEVSLVGRVGKLKSTGTGAHGSKTGGKRQGRSAEKRARHDLLAEFLCLREAWKNDGDDERFAGEVLAFIDLLQADPRYALIYTRTGITAKTKKSLSEDELEEREAADRKKQQKGAACRELLELQTKKQKPAPGLLARASDEIISCLIERAASERLYNLGYPLSGKASANRTRTKNTILDLIDAWCSAHAAGGGMTLQNGAGGFDPEPYQKLYDHLYRDSEMFNVLIPVRIDPQTGMGIYIVGRNHYANAHKDKELRFPYKGRSCGIEILGYWESMCDSNEASDQAVDLTLGEPESGKIRGFPNVEEANSWFVNLICRDADKFESFRYWNGAMPDVPRALTKYFGRYFENGADDFIATPKELDETRAEFS